MADRENLNILAPILTYGIGWCDRCCARSPVIRRTLALSVCRNAATSATVMTLWPESFSSNSILILLSSSEIFITKLRSNSRLSVLSTSGLFNTFTMASCCLEVIVSLQQPSLGSALWHPPPACLCHPRSNTSRPRLLSSPSPVPLPRKTSRHVREEFRTHVGEHRTHTHPNSSCE